MNAQDVTRRLQAAFGPAAGRVVRVVDVDYGECFWIHLARHDARPPFILECDRADIERLPTDESWAWLWEAVDASSP